MLSDSNSALQYRMISPSPQHTSLMFSKFQPFSLKISRNGRNFENRAKLISDSNSALQNQYELKKNQHQYNLATLQAVSGRAGLRSNMEACPEKMLVDPSLRVNPQYRFRGQTNNIQPVETNVYISFTSLLYAEIRLASLPNLH